MPEGGETMRRIDFMDASFLLMESREAPMHIAGLNLHTFPEGADQQKFMARLGDAYESATEFRPPFGEYVATGRLGQFGPLYWEKDKELDMKYHVRHSALPKPGRYRELFALVSRLHGTLLDRSRPLWEIHLIEGLQNRQFAIYTKMHHAAIDGIGALGLTEGMCSTNRRTRNDLSPLSLEAYKKYTEAGKDESKPVVAPRERDLRAVAELLKEQFDTTSHMLGMIREYAGTWLGGGHGLAVPWRHVSKTQINTRISASRRYVAQSWEFDRFKAVGKATGGTVNDVVLAMCSGALRRYLMAQGDLPIHSLRALVPVSMRTAGDVGTGNLVTVITANLATRYADPEKRMNVIMESTRAGKDMIRGLSRSEAVLYAGLAQLPLFLSNLLGLTGRFPAYSTTISNVPGPRKQLYWNGASLDGSYPVSAIMHGFALNITLVSYRGALDFGIMACRRSVPQMQRLIDYLDESLVELEVMAA
jgi:diacylglycerol O-acyltransferase